MDRESTIVNGGGTVRGFNVNHAGAAPNSYGGGIYLVPSIILEWQKICDDPEEFVEIRNQWKI